MGVGIGDEVRRNVALVELHPLGELQLEPEGLAFLNRDHPILADTLKRLGNGGTDLRIRRRDRRHRRNATLDSLNILREVLDERDDRTDCRLDAPLETHRVGSCREVAESFPHHGLGQHCGRGSSVTGHVVGLGCYFLGELSTHVLPRVVKLDLLGDGHPIIGDGRGAPLLLKHYVTSLGSKSYLDHIGELVDTRLQTTPRVFVETKVLRCHLVSFPLILSYSNRQPTIANRSRDERIRYSSPSCFNSVPANLE